VELHDKHGYVAPFTPDLASDPTVVALRPALGSKTLLIKTADDYECASMVLMQVKTSLDIIETARLKITVPLNAALKAANEQARTAKAPYLNEEQIIKTALLAYDDIEEEAREDEQRKANAIARAEQDRLEAIADAAREKADTAARELREQAEAAQAKGDVRAAEKLLGRASTIESTGEAKADLYNERASQVVAMVSSRAPPKVTGIAIPKVWDFEVMEEDKVPLAYRPVDETLIRKVVTALKGLTNIPGVRVFERKRISAGRA
jgi:uncharacterized membrane protein YqiK